MGRIVVIGTSQGGVTALSTLISGLKQPFGSPILIVLHIGSSRSMLPSLLKDIDSFTASFARQGEPLIDGHIYVAPPDQHLLVMDGQAELSRGPRENWARPAVDPLLRSAAQVYGPDAIGIILTGRLNDGTAGLYEIKRQGGVAIVQSPGEAEAPDMPRSALENVAVDYCLPLADIARLLNRLVLEPSERRGVVHSPKETERAITAPSAQTCPECGGAMREEQVGRLTRFVCHIGHVMTAEVLAASQLEVLENHISEVLRGLNERAALCRDLAEKYLAAGHPDTAETWGRAATEAQKREALLKKMGELSWQHPESEERGEASVSEGAGAEAAKPAA